MSFTRFELGRVVGRLARVLVCLVLTTALLCCCAVDSGVCHWVACVLWLCGRYRRV